MYIANTFSQFVTSFDYGMLYYAVFSPLGGKTYQFFFTESGILVIIRKPFLKVPTSALVYFQSL